MSRATINTGGIPFMEKQDGVTTSQNQKPCHILVLGDFSGRNHRGMDDAAALSQRKIWEVTKDNFEELFYKLEVTLQLAIADEPIRFHEFDELHPDYIYDRVDLFSKFRALKRKLKDKSRFAEAAEEIQGWANQSANNTAQVDASQQESKPVSPNDGSAQELLDELLHSVPAQQAQKESVQQLIQSIIAPYVVPRADPRQGELMESVDQAASHLMRKIMHSSAFQSIEASWRGLYWLVRKLELDNNLRLFVADVSFAETILDNQAHEESTTQLHQRLVEQRAAEGAVPFSYIVADYQIQDQLDHCDGLANLASVAADSNGILLASASEKVAGCKGLSLQPEPEDWQPSEDFSLLWQAMREQEYARYVVLMAPRFLLRLPYGKRTSPTENLEFEELPQTVQHEFYLWANSSWLAALILGNAYSNHGVLDRSLQQIAGLPLHVQNVSGESQVMPCAEILMLDRTASALQSKGVNTVRSVVDKDYVIIPDLKSFSELCDELPVPWVYTD